MNIGKQFFKEIISKNPTVFSMASVYFLYNFSLSLEMVLNNRWGFKKMRKYQAALFFFPFVMQLTKSFPCCLYACKQIFRENFTVPDIRSCSIRIQ